MDLNLGVYGRGPENWWVSKDPCDLFGDKEELLILGKYFRTVEPANVYWSDKSFYDPHLLPEPKYWDLHNCRVPLTCPQSSLAGPQKGLPIFL